MRPHANAHVLHRDGRPATQAAAVASCKNNKLLGRDRFTASCAGGFGGARSSLPARRLPSLTAGEVFAIRWALRVAVGLLANFDRETRRDRKPLAAAVRSARRACAELRRRVRP